MPVMSLGEPIAHGSVAEIYAWGESQILKLFFDWVPAYGVQHEARQARAIHAAGLPAPAVFDVIKVRGRFGLIYQRIKGCSMGEKLLKTPESNPKMLRQLAQLFAELQAEIHTYSNVPNLLCQRQLYKGAIHKAETLPLDLKEATLKLLDEMPDGNQLCHGDFHPYNVLMPNEGPVIIDWNNADIGNPMADIAMTKLILSSIQALEASSPIDQFKTAYLKSYFHLRPANQQQLVAWQPIVAAVRLSDVGHQEWLINQIRSGLALSD